MALQHSRVTETADAIADVANRTAELLADINRVAMLALLADWTDSFSIEGALTATDDDDADNMDGGLGTDTIYAGPLDSAIGEVVL